MSREKEGAERAADFIRAIVEEDLRNNKHGGKVVTRFPPEPNGFLHIGHAKSICLNFGIAAEYGGRCHLRFDDTDPIKEETHFEEAIIEAVKWLGFDYGDHLYHASDYFETLYDLAVRLIEMGKAYVCSLSLDEIREYRGSVTEPGRESPYRERSVEENIDLFARMRAGEFPDGAHVLRAKIDMAASNMKMRDPLLYRIRHVSHHMTGDKWCIYPLYDFTHCLSDSIEGITHSICTLEFENNRELYDWIIETLDMPNKPRQYEFARLNINYSVMSKRKIQALVGRGVVSGWDDPRLMTIAGLRRRGYTPSSIRSFSASVGVAKANSVVDMAQLEFAIRDDLNSKAPRVLAVLQPLKVVVTNYPEGEVEEFDAPYYPEDVGKPGSRSLPFTREIYIERDDFMEKPPKGFYRLSPGGEVRLRYGYIIRCDEVIKDSAGNVVELRCSYDEKSPPGSNPSDGRRIKGTIHWVSKSEGVAAEVREYGRLFTVEDPNALDGEELFEAVDEASCRLYPDAIVEPSLRGTASERHFQFERIGFFVTDRIDSTGDKLVFNRIVPLKDSWAKKSGVEKRTTPMEMKGVERKQKEPSSERTRVEKVFTDEEKERAENYISTYGLAKEDALFIAGELFLGDFFIEALKEGVSAKLLANWIINELQRVRKENEGERLPVTPRHLAELVKAIEEGVISTKIAKELFSEMAATGGSPVDMIEKRGLRQIDDRELLSPLVERLVAQYPDVVAQIKGGRTNRAGFFVGEVMKETKGKANPQLVQELLKEKIDAVE